MSSTQTLFLVAGRRVGASERGIGQPDFRCDRIAVKDIERIVVARRPMWCSPVSGTRWRR